MKANIFHETLKLALVHQATLHGLESVFGLQAKSGIRKFHVPY